MSRTGRKSKSYKTIIFRGILYTVVIPALVVFLFIAVLLVKNDIETNSVQSGMEAYLQNKYGQEFTVERPKYHGGGDLVDGYYEAEAHPSSGADKGAEFIVSGGGNNNFSDSYISALYGHREKGQLARFLGEVGVKPTKYFVRIGMSRSVQNSLYAKNIPELQKVLKDYGDAVVYSVAVVVDGGGPGNDDVENVKKLAAYAESRHKHSYAVRYTINSNKDDGVYYCQYDGADDKTIADIDKSCFVKNTGRE